MRIFISWSGERSKAVAGALKAWVEDVFQDVDPWMSAHDIEAGARWGDELNQRLGECNFGILCLTPENLIAPWILFEAGSLAKAFDTARVVPYRFGLSAGEVGFPLAQFQSVGADRPGTLRLLESINSARETPLAADRLLRLFEKWWPDLESNLGKVQPVTGTAAPNRPEREMIEEILELTRQAARTQATAVPDPLSASDGLRGINSHGAGGRWVMRRDAVAPVLPKHISDELLALPWVYGAAMKKAGESNFILILDCLDMPSEAEQLASLDILRNDNQDISKWQVLVNKVDRSGNPVP